MKNYLPKVANDKANQKQLVEDESRQEFIESLRLSEGERYFIVMLTMNPIAIKWLLLNHNISIHQQIYFVYRMKL